MRSTLCGLLLATTTLTAPAFAEPLAVEKPELKFGFIKLTDMAPLAVAYEQGYFVRPEQDGTH